MLSEGFWKFGGISVYLNTSVTQHLSFYSLLRPTVRRQRISTTERVSTDLRMWLITEQTYIRWWLVIKGPVIHYVPHCAKNNVHKEDLRPGRYKHSAPIIEYGAYALASTHTHTQSAQRWKHWLTQSEYYFYVKCKKSGWDFCAKMLLSWHF